jgi:hypothetical protein
MTYAEPNGYIPNPTQNPTQLWVGLNPNLMPSIWWQEGRGWSGHNRSPLPLHATAFDGWAMRNKKRQASLAAWRRPPRRPSSAGAIPSPYSIKDQSYKDIRTECAPSPHSLATLGRSSGERNVRPSKKKRFLAGRYTIVPTSSSFASPSLSSLHRPSPALFNSSNNFSIETILGYPFFFAMFLIFFKSLCLPFNPQGRKRESSEGQTQRMSLC